MMNGTFVVFGATGQQGGAVARVLSQHPNLSKELTIKIAVRNVVAPAAIELQKLGCEVVHGDFDDKDSLRSALKGAVGAFLVTNSIFDELLYERELRQGKAAADAAIQEGLQYLIFSTLPSVREISNGRYTKVDHAEVKYDIEQYIRGLPIASAFLSLGSFMQNFTNIFRPQPLGDGRFALRASMSPETTFALVDGTYISQAVAVVLEDFEAYKGRTEPLTTQLITLKGIAGDVSVATGKEVVYMQVSQEDFLKALPPAAADDFWQFGLSYTENGYFGPKTASIDLERFGPSPSLIEFARKNLQL